MTLFVLNRTLVFQMNRSAKTPRLRQYLIRYAAFQTDIMKKLYFGLILILAACSAQNRIDIPKTRVSLIPPDGFVALPGFNGLQNDDKNGIEVRDLTGNYFVLKGQYSSDQLEAKGLKVLNTETVRIQNYDGFLHKIVMDNKSNVYNLVFGDSTFCAVLFGTYKSSSTSDGIKMKEALLTANYDKSKTPASLNAEVSLNDKESQFKLATASSNYMIYALKGEAKSNYGMEPYLKVHELPFDKNSTPESIADIVIEGLKNAGYTNIRVQNVSSEDLKQFRAYEFDLYCDIGNMKTIIYNLVLKNNKRALTIQGSCFGDCEHINADFKKLAHSITVTD